MEGATFKPASKLYCVVAMATGGMKKHRYLPEDALIVCKSKEDAGVFLERGGGVGGAAVSTSALPVTGANATICLSSRMQVFAPIASVKMLNSEESL